MCGPSSNSMTQAPPGRRSPSFKRRLHDARPEPATTCRSVRALPAARCHSSRRSVRVYRWSPRRARVRQVGLRLTAHRRLRFLVEPSYCAVKAFPPSVLPRRAFARGTAHAKESTSGSSRFGVNDDAVAVEYANRPASRPARSIAWSRSSTSSGLVETPNAVWYVLTAKSKGALLPEVEAASSSIMGRQFRGPHPPEVKPHC